MEIKAKNETTFKVISLSKEYKSLAIVYLLCAVVSMGLFFAVSSKITFIIAFAVSLFGVVFNFYNYNQLLDDTYELTDCYIKISSKYIEFKQLVNAKYQTGKIFMEEISKIMKVEDGFQIWFDSESGNSLFMIDDDVVNVETACINYYAYETEEYINLYLQFIRSLPDTTERFLDTAEWKDSSDTINWFKMALPALLYLIPITLNFFM